MLSICHDQITDACSACFEQRIVFTQQVLAKALNQMVSQMLLMSDISVGQYLFLDTLFFAHPMQVDQTPLPLLFMRTVIQAIDAFPSLVRS